LRYVSTVPLAPDGTLTLLASSALCRGMPPGAVATLASEAAVLERGPGDVLCVEGTPATALFVIVRGVVKLVRALESGRDVIVELLGRGDLFGESALADGAGYDTRAVCVHPSTVLAIPRAAALEFVAAHPEAVRNLLALMNESVVRAHRRVEDLAVFGVRQRIARFLLRLADWAGRAEQGRTVVPVALSRQELAALVGTTMETAIRVMSGLRREGLVEPARRGVILPNREALELLAREET
jgi:CRP-like cAMP-binding protein